MEKPVLVGTDGTPEETVKLYQAHYDYVCLFDGALNLAGNLTKEICNEVLLQLKILKADLSCRCRIMREPCYKRFRNRWRVPAIFSDQRRP